MQHFPLTEKIHTDILEEKYGPISAKVIKHNKVIRESHLVDSKGISRTYTLTFFEERFDKEISKIDKEIKEGKLIGKAFREHGYVIRKNVIEVTLVPVSSKLKEAFATKDKQAKARFSEFYAKKKGKPAVIYGTVAEIYSPDFRKPKINQVDKLQISAPTEILEKNGFSKEEIWRRIGDDNNYEDSSERYNKSKKESSIIVKEFKDKVIRYLKNSPTKLL